MDRGPWTLDQRLQIERERMTDQLRSENFHARLNAETWKEKVSPMQTDHIFSPSQLETYAACPFKYFANRVLGIPQQKECSPELDADDRGTLFHDSMEIFMRENAELFLEARENRDREPLLLEKLGETVAAVFEKSKGTYPYGHPELYEHLKQKTLHQATLVLQKELEQARNLSAPLEPAHFEWTFGKGKSSPFEMEGLRLGGRIDRIDIDPKTGHFLVLDYKTGTVNKFKAGLLEGLSLQLPLYILAVRKLLFPNGQAVGGLLVESKVAKKKTGLVDAAFNKTHFQIHRSSHSLMKTEEMEALLQQAAQWAADYVKQIRSGFFSARPKECKAVCDYKEICRYAGKPFV
ncbi:MAG: PD-(D/E)XK nuclease family protein [Deltaproteobacteria bacterium]|nr:PD-(D/E)XK nuclease family protein [Deltaproteobacteria bacterium]